MTKYNDPTHLPENINPNVPAPYNVLAMNVRNKMFGEDVRESLAQAIEGAGMAVNEWEHAQIALTEDAEVINARIGLDGTRYRTLKHHLDTLWEETNSKADKKRTETDINNLNAYKADISYVNDLVSAMVQGTPKGHFLTLDDLKKAYPNGSDGYYLVTENGHIYFWSGNLSDWISAGEYIEFKLSENSVHQKNIKMKSVTKNKLSNNIILSDENIKSLLKTSDNNKHLKVNVHDGSLIESDGVLKVDYAISLNPSKFENIILNGNRITLLQNEVILNNEKTTFYKEYLQSEMLDVCSAFIFGQDDLRYRVHVNMRDIDVPSGNSTNLLYVDNQDIRSEAQNNFGSSTAYNYVGIHGSGRVEFSIRKEFLYLNGFLVDPQGAIDYLMSLEDMSCFVRTYEEKKELIPISVKKGDKCSLKMTTAIKEVISLYTNEIEGDKKMKTSYMTTITNNLHESRYGEIVRVNVNFKEDEVPSEKHLKVYVNDSEVPFEFLPNFGITPLSEESKSYYKNGCLKTGQLLFNIEQLAPLEQKEIRIDIYESEQEVYLQQKITMTREAYDQFNCVVGAYRYIIGPSQGFGLKKASYGTGFVGVDGNTIERAIVVGSSSVGINATGTTDIQILGSGVSYYRFIAKQATNFKGLSLVSIVDVFSDGKVETERSLVIDDLRNLQFIPDRLNLSSTILSNSSEKNIFTSEKEQSQGTNVNGRKFINTVHSVQGAAEGAGDGHNGVKNSFGQVSLGSNGSLMTSVIFLKNYDFKPNEGDYWSVKNIYTISNNEDINLTEIKNMNPLIAFATTSNKRQIKKYLKESAIEYLDNSFEKSENITAFLGANVLTRLMYADVSNSYDTLKEEIQNYFDTFKTTYKNSDTIWEVYSTENKGLAYTARDANALGDIKYLFEKFNDEVNATESERLIHEFAKFFIKLEEYCGSTGAIYLDYSNSNDVLNAEAAAMDALKASINLNNNVVGAVDVYNRIEAHFLNQIWHENILPYSSDFDPRADYRGHYHLFSLSDYVSNLNKKLSFHVTSYLMSNLTSEGSLKEMRFNCQPSRRGDIHPYLYAINICLFENSINSLTIADLIIKKLKNNLKPTGGRQHPIDNWYQGTVVTHNLQVELQLVCHIIIKLEKEGI